MPGPGHINICLLYTSDAADDLLCVDLGGRRIIKKKKHTIKPPLIISSHRTNTIHKINIHDKTYA